MFAIRAHIKGSVIVPDEPFPFSQDTGVVVLVDADDAQSVRELEAATQQYYQNLSDEERAEDNEWGQGVSHGLSDAWDK